MEEPFVHKIIKQGQLIESEMYLSKNGFIEKLEPLKKSDVDKAVFAFPIKHYSNTSNDTVFSDRVGEKKENFSILEMDEFSVFVGDIYQFGEATIQVSQPGIVTREEVENGYRTGWYFRVVNEGNIQAETDLTLLERPYPQFSIAACSEIMYINREDLWAADELFQCEALGLTWRKALRKRLRGY
ncbi:MOSC domain-containing protein [Oceanobacillus sp. 1P07AA]|uniref:MOSC domain-containing protein n=1 Tax=Oceanobacillus sp. 1P07AA TaxID=3132293 RepID=UPI0039A64407